MNATKPTDLTNAEIDAAFCRRDRRLRNEPLAVSVRYTPTRDNVVVEMNNGASLVIPRHLLQGLGNASRSQLRNARVSGRGASLTWPDLDADFTIMSLLQGVYGGTQWMSELARQAGAVRSESKAKAARINVKKAAGLAKPSPTKCGRSRRSLQRLAEAPSVVVPEGLQVGRAQV